MNTLRLAWKNIIKNPLNLGMSILLFGLGVGLITFIMLLNDQLKDKFDKNLAEIDLVVGAKGSPLQMILCNMFHIDYPTGNISIKEATPFLREGHPLIKKAIPLSLGDNYKSYRIVGTTPALLDMYGAVVESGRIWDTNFEVVIGKAIATDQNLKIGDKFISSHGFVDDPDLAHGESSFEVVGILNGTGTVADQLILTNTSTIWAVHDHGGGDSPTHDEEDEKNDKNSHEDHAHTDSKAEIKPVNNDTLAVAKINNSNAGLLTHPDKEITSVLIQYKSRTNFQALNFGRNINENTDLQSASPAIEINRLYSMIGVGSDMLGALAYLIAFVSAVSIFISLLKTMRERKYELALIRVMGGSRFKVFSLIILEGVILALIGYMIGMLLSHVGMEILSKFLKDEFRYSFSGWHFVREEIYLLAFSLFIGFIAALIPAVQASRTDINKTLSEK